MLHLISRRAWKQTQSGRVEGEATPPAPAMPSSNKKRKRSPSPQLETEASSTKRDKRGRPSTSKIVEEPELPEEEEDQPPEVVARPSRNRRKSAKFLEIEEESSASTASEKETEAPQKANRRKSGRGDKAKDVEVAEKIKEKAGGTQMTIVTGKGKKGKTTSIRIKPILEPKEEPEPAKTASPERSSGGDVTGGHRKKRKSGKHVIKPLPPLDIPSDSNITVKEESGIKLKLILSPKDRSPTAAEVSPSEPSTEEKKKSKKDRGKKGKEKGKKDEIKEDKVKAKLKFGNQVLSLDGDKVTHSEIPKSKSGSKSKKRKHESEEEVIAPSVQIEKPSKKRKTDKDKTEGLSTVKLEEIIAIASPKAEKKGKKQKKDSKDAAVTPEETPLLLDKDKNESKSSKSKSNKEKERHKSKDKHKEDSKVEDVPNKDKDKKDKKKKKTKHEKTKSDSAASRSDLETSLELSQTSQDSFEDTDASLVIDESFTASKDHSGKKKKTKKERDGEKSKDSSKESEGERTAEKRKDKSKHKHHRHDKHHGSDKKSKHKKHRSGDGQMTGHMTMLSDQMESKDIFGSLNTSQTSISDLSMLNASARSLANGTTPEGAVIVKSEKSSSHSSSKSKKKSKKDPDKTSGDDKKKKEDKIKRPLSAYMLWCKEARPSVVAENPGADFSAISKLMGIKWRQLTDKDKSKWQNMQRKQVIKHKNIPTLSAKKISSRRNSGHSGKPKSPSRLHPPNMEAIDIAAHLRLLGESLSTVGGRLQEHKGEIEIHGSVSVLLDSTLCALGPLMALTSQVPEIDGCSRDTHVSTLENIAYIMPGL